MASRFIGRVEKLGFSGPGCGDNETTGDPGFLAGDENRPRRGKDFIVRFRGVFFSATVDDKARSLGRDAKASEGFSVRESDAEENLPRPARSAR